MYNTMSFIPVALKAVSVSESLEACCYFKKEEGVMTEKYNHTVPWYFIQSDVFMLRMPFRKNKMAQQASHTHTLTWIRRTGFPQQSAISHTTSMYIHTFITHMDEKNTL